MNSARSTLPTTLVLLPGMDGSGLLFESFVAALRTISTVPIAVLSYPRDAAMGYAQLTELVARDLPREGNLVLLGESYSGPVAVAVAAAHPQRVVGLILCCSFVRNPRPALRQLATLAGWLAGAGIPLPLASRLLFGRHATRALRERLQQALRGITAATWRARMRAVANVDASEAMASIGASILCLRATEDRLIPRTTVEALRRLQPAIEIVDVTGPHALLQACPQECAAIVARFVPAPAADNPHQRLRDAL
jgi:pimeloyl-[acyl-carrier protein] methyl ester esterase